MADYKEYKPVPISDNDDDSTSSPADHIQLPLRPSPSPRRRNIPLILLSASNLIFILLAAYFYAASRTATSYINGFPTDFRDARRAIEYEQRTFTGPLRWNASSHKLYRDTDPSETQYFGAPSPEIDEAWKQLLYGEFLAMSDDEAAPFRPEIHRLRRTGHYHMELDVMHSFHCVNALRVHIDRDYYAAHDTIWSHGDLGIKQDDWTRIHMDHCLDQLFQSVRCFGDLSPVPLYTYPRSPVALGIGVAHTCRRWEPVREWYDKRNEERRAMNEFRERPVWGAHKEEDGGEDDDGYSDTSDGYDDADGGPR